MIELSMIAILAFGFVLWRSIARGKIFVKSVIFLDALDCGEPVDIANRIAATFGRDPYSDESSTKRANAIRVSQFGGKQLPIIDLARRKGFQL